MPQAYHNFSFFILHFALIKTPLVLRKYKRRKIAVPLFFITLAVTGPAGCYPSLPDALSPLSPTRASSRRPRLSIGSDGITLSVHRDMKLERLYHRIQGFVKSSYVQSPELFLVPPCREQLWLFRGITSINMPLSGEFVIGPNPPERFCLCARYCGTVITVPYDS